MKDHFSLTDFLLAFLIVGPAILLWELGVSLFNLPVYILPAPTKIIKTLTENLSLYAGSSLITLEEALAGLTLGLIAGATTAILLGMWPRMERGVMTLAILVKSTPLVAIAPLLGRHRRMAAPGEARHLFQRHVGRPAAIIIPQVAEIDPAEPHIPLRALQIQRIRLVLDLRGQV